MDAKTLLLLAVGVAAVCCTERKLESGNTRCYVQLLTGQFSCEKVLQGECEGGETTESSQDSGDDTTASAGNGDDGNGEEQEDDDCKVTDKVQVTLATISHLNADNLDDNNPIIFTNFVVSNEASATTIPNSDAKADSLEVSATHERGTVTISLYIVTEDGTLDQDGETSEVEKEQVKFTIKVEPWQFPDTATGMEVKLEISSRDAPEVKDDDDLLVELGGNAEMTLYKKIFYTNNATETWADMETSYPKLETASEKHYLVLRFDKFETSVSYDPTIELGDYPKGEDGPISAAMTSYVMSSLTCLLTVAVAMFF